MAEQCASARITALRLLWTRHRNGVIAQAGRNVAENRQSQATRENTGMAAKTKVVLTDYVWDSLVVEEIEGSNLSLDVNRFLIHPCW